MPTYMHADSLTYLLIIIIWILFKSASGPSIESLDASNETRNARCFVLPHGVVGDCRCVVSAVRLPMRTDSSHRCSIQTATVDMFVRSSTTESRSSSTFACRWSKSSHSMKPAVVWRLSFTSPWYYRFLVFFRNVYDVSRSKADYSRYYRPSRRRMYCCATIRFRLLQCSFRRCAEDHNR